MPPANTSNCKVPAKKRLSPRHNWMRCSNSASPASALSSPRSKLRWRKLPHSPESKAAEDCRTPGRFGDMRQVLECGSPLPLWIASIPNLTRCFGSRFGKDAGQRHRRAVLPFAFVGGFHEGENFDRLFGLNRRLARFEKAGDLIAQFFVTAFTAGMQNRFAAESGGTK